MKSYLIKVGNKINQKVTALSIKKAMPKYELLPILLVQGLRYEEERERCSESPKKSEDI
jgi:hypothetical protein